MAAQQSKAVMDEAEDLQQATERAEHAEAEVARLREQMERSAGKERPSGGRDTGTGTATHKSVAAHDEDRGVERSSLKDSAPEKEPPSPSSAGDESRIGGGEAELRKDSMMAHLLDSLAAGEDIGHYGRLVFAMVARHFLPHEEVVSRLTQDRDFSEEDAELMLRQTEGRDYSPPKRDRILEWQAQQEFPIVPHPDDPDCGNLYRNLKFPQEVYRHIGHYQEHKAEAGE